MRTCSKDIFIMKKILIFVLIVLFLPIQQANSAGVACRKSQVNTIKSNLICKQITKYRYNWIEIKKDIQVIPSPKPIAPTVETKQESTVNKFVTISESASSQIISKVNKTNVSILNTNYIVSNTINTSHVIKIKDQLNFSYTYWKNQYNGDFLNIILWDYESAAWADKIYKEIKGNWNLDQKPSSAAKSPEFCTNAWQSNFKNNGKPKYVIISCENPKYYETLRFKMAHEYTHVVQDHLGLIQPNSSIWVIEGGAHYYGQVLGFEGNKDLINKNRKEFLYSLKYYMDNGSFKYNIKDINKKDFISYMKTMHGRSADEPKTVSAYLLGSIATEYLIGLYGEEKLIAFWKEHSINSNIEINFLKIYGLSIDTFYSDLYEYYIFHLKDFSYGN